MVGAMERAQLRNARIYTGEPPAAGRSAPPHVSALCVSDEGRILQNSAEQRPSRVIELPGEAVVPGFIDTHAHLSSLGARPGDLELRDLASVQALLDAVARRAAGLRDDAWITGSGWEDDSWPERTPPTAHALDAASGGRPTVLFRRDRHALLASGSALRRAGLSDEAPHAGLLVDNQMDRLTAHVPQPTTEDIAEEAVRMGGQLAAAGVTCIHEAWTSPALWRALGRLAQSAALPIRVRAMLAKGFDEAPVSERPEWLRAIAVKGFADGALGSRGAQLRHPYCDEAGACGAAVDSDQALSVRAELALRWSLQLAIHAIGDEGTRRVLDLFERYEASVPGRWRIEHAQMIHPEDMRRLKGVCLATQPVHFLSDGPWAIQRLGLERLSWCYRARSAIEAGAIVAFGSDFPIDSEDPRVGVAALEAATHPQVDVWGRAEERLSRYDALDGYWRRAAYLACDELRLGRLLPGYFADLVCLNVDPFTCPHLTDLAVVATYVGGRRVYPQSDREGT